jgi:ribulose 1,5-bisphosphate synthetase/thiazole synthase
MVLPVPNPTKCFWIEAAESPLRDFRSTPDLPAETDIVIVGSGYAGATAAYWVDKVGNFQCVVKPAALLFGSGLTQKFCQYTETSAGQPQVTILEARDICGGATGRNGMFSFP